MRARRAVLAAVELRAPLLVGVFVGGASSRMGRCKALLPAPGGGLTLVDRAILLGKSLGHVVLVGRCAELRLPGVPTLEDALPGSGPLAGLVALLEAARGAEVLALACDMPRVSLALLQRLASAPACAVVAPRRNGVWEPLCARYDASLALGEARARLEARQLGLQGLLDALHAQPLALDPDEHAQLDDWDRPEDVR